MLSLIVSIIVAAAQWQYFKKMGHEGWEGIIPIYSTYVIFQELYGNGWRMLLLLIPLFNIFVIFKLNIDLAHAFNLNTGFGIGLTLLAPIFSCILGFGSSIYRDGSMARV
ncbi:MAG: hypothetical protein K2O18_18450 [Oscillospiraceae bacterium]|nr:hypothetical protein [Oscillospiraceae bacterium]